MRIINKNEALALFKNKYVNFISGSFDLIHAGHIDFLKQAKDYDSKVPLLIVVLDDRNIRFRKGPTRPIYPLYQRMKILSAIKYIDYLMAWEDNWKELRGFVENIKISNLFVGSKDLGIDNKKEIAFKQGFNLITLKQYNQVSTTSIIKRILNNAEKSER
jgi:D-beta-D-heptose 7-phosphate kinase/D-beta-D-heptose 1-phosphate adenosyltransferase